jgi:murein L,D-transpeptidase YcbB/YkuD
MVFPTRLSFWPVFRLVFGLYWLFFACIPTVNAAAQADSPALHDAMVQYLEHYPVELMVRDQQQPAISHRDVCLAAIYHKRGARPLWVTQKGPKKQAAVILKYLQSAEEEGLDSRKYQVEEIGALWEETSLNALAQLDILLTFNVVKYVHDVRHGQIEPYLANPNLFKEAGKPTFDPVGLIDTLTATEDLDRFFRKLPPQHRHYQALKKGLAVYGQLIDLQKWEPIGRGKTLRQGDQNERIQSIRKRLAWLAGEEEATSESNVYDVDLVQKIRRFQGLHGLKKDGIIGRNTLAALNITPAERVEQIKINMARWRWQDQDIGSEYVLVNIADFQLFVYSEGELKLNMPVIVGKFQHQTPVFSDRITYLEFNPYWNIPPSIAVKEELAELRNNPKYLVEKKIRLFSSWQRNGVELDSTVIDWSKVTPRQMAGFKLRQDPGPTNALGQLKFVFPNHHAIYLHDTPAKNLFDETKRSFSHGCIRVSDPARLALFMLQRQDDGWDAADVRERMEAGERQVVPIRPPLPIHLTYQTAWVDKTDEIHFNRDIYGRDKQLRNALYSN